MDRRRNAMLRLGILVVLSVIILALDRADAPVISHVREGASTVFGPVEGAASRVTLPVRNAWNGVREYDALVAENAELQEQITESAATDIEETDTARQLEELSELVGVEWTGDIESVTARVTSGPRSNFSNAVEINRGSDHGIAEGMAVISGRGLAGQVTRVSRSTSTVELITSSDLQVGIRMADDGELGVARGQGRGEPLVVDVALDVDAEVEEETGLVTSGLDRSRYPEAIPVARVVDTREGPGALSLELLAEPLVDVQRLSYVSVLLWEPST
jgi:rod shape-determining protein MreC